MLRELKGYTGLVEKAITNISVCTAVAECDLTKGETVGLKMQQGLLYAVSPSAEGARGVTTSDAREGEDVGVTTIEGIVGLKIGEVTIFRVPGVGKGGSRDVNLTRLAGGLKDRRFVGALGIEAVVTLQRAGVNFQMYGVQEAAIEATYCGLNPAVVCAEDRIYGLIRRLEEVDIEYEIADIAIK
jgi:putative transcriptional regulator